MKTKLAQLVELNRAYDGLRFRLNPHQIMTKGGNLMTSLQVDYWKLGETKRSNKASEGLRSNELKESKRHNKATEELEKERNEIERGKAQETARHNVETENTANYNAITQRTSVQDWREIQDQQIGIQRDQNAIQEERNKLQDLDLIIQQDRNLVLEEQANRDLDLREQELELKRSQNARGWTETIVDTLQGVSQEGRGWLDSGTKAAKSWFEPQYSGDSDRSLFDTVKSRVKRNLGFPFTIFSAD